MPVKFTFATILLFLISTSTFSQEFLTLDRCIEIALENNIDIKRARNNALIAESNLEQSKYAFLPSLNANIDYNLLFGTTFDDANAQLINTTTRGSSPRIFSEVILFSGLENVNNVKRNQLLENSSLLQITGEMDNIRISVVGLYLQVLTDQENLRITNERINLMQEQLLRAQKRVNAGVSNMEQVYNINSQIAAENMRLVNQENQLKRDKLALLQTIQVNQEYDYTIQEIPVTEDIMQQRLDSYQQVYQQALNYSPFLKSADARILASQRNYKIARSAAYPSLTMSGAIGSRYSSNGAYDPEVNQVVSIPYFEQLDLNQYEYLAFNLRIPIFNRRQVINNIQVAKIDQANAELDYKQTLVDLTNRLQEAYLELVSARSTYLAATENLQALDQSYQFAQTSYENGRLDFYSYLESLNNKNQAEIDLVISRYNFTLRDRILEIMVGEDVSQNK